MKNRSDHQTNPAREGDITFGSLLKRHFRFEGTENKPKKEIPAPPQLKGYGKFLKLLKTVPFLLITLFIFSFYWDLDGVTIEPFGYALEMQGLLRIVSISGLIGFLTNWVAITMLFRPLVKRPLLGQGLVPAQKERIAYRLATAIEEDLINPDIIREKIIESGIIQKYRKKHIDEILKSIETEEFRSDLKSYTLKYINSVVSDHKFKNKVSIYIADEIYSGLDSKPFEKAALKSYTLLKGRTLEEMIESSLKDLPITFERNYGLVDEFLNQIPEKVRNASADIDTLLSEAVLNLTDRIDIRHLVEERLQSYDEYKLERMIMNATNEQLKMIQYLGAVLGTIGGFVIWKPLLSLTFLGGFGALLYVADRILYK